MFLGNLHEVFDKLELELERSTKDCTVSVRYLQDSAYVTNMSPYFSLTILFKKQMYLTIG